MGDQLSVNNNDAIFSFLMFSQVQKLGVCSIDSVSSWVGSLAHYGHKLPVTALKRNNPKSSAKWSNRFNTGFSFFSVFVFMLVHVLLFWLVLLNAHSYQHPLLTSCRQHWGIICQLLVLFEDSVSSKKEQSMCLGTMQIGNIFLLLPLENPQPR